MDVNARVARLFALLISLPLLACNAGSDSLPDASISGRGGNSGGGGASPTTGAGGSSGAGGASSAGTGGTAGSGNGGSGAGGASSAGTGGHGGAGGSSTAGTGGGGGGVTGAGGTAGAGNTGGGVPRVDLTGKKALIIVDSPSSPDDGEVVLQQVLQVRGMTATFAAVTDGAMAAGQNVLLVSSGTAADIQTSFGTAAVPMIVFGNSYFQTLGLSPTGSSNKGTIDGHTMMVIGDASTSLAGGMTVGTTFTALVPSRSASLYWGTPGGQAIKVATPMGATTQGVAWAFEKGAMTAAGTAPARRVAFAWKTNLLQDLTVEAFRLLDAAFDWTAGSP
jgi:hypothetical protein